MKNMQLLIYLLRLFSVAAATAATAATAEFFFRTKIF